jgi:glycolate oxidase iron-sulfur subunit
MAADHLTGARELIADCVHCGFCLDSCPTYVLWAAEADSPRGRIVLLDRAIEDGGRISEETVAHLDACLGCLACVTACPSGVRYDELIERARGEVERQHKRPLGERLLRRALFATLPNPRALRTLTPAMAAGRAAGGLLGARLEPLAQLVPRTRLRDQLRIRLPERTLPNSAPRGRVALLLGCVQRVLFAEVHQATIGVLAAEGWEVLAPRAPDCCGALELHAGESDRALERARATVEAISRLGPVEHVVVNSAGCGASMKRYGELLGTPEARAFAARVRDVSELVCAAPARARRAPLPLRVVYHDACHLQHAQRVTDEPRAMLRAIPELELLEVGVEADVCCGSAGVYNLLAPRPAAQLGERKARHLIETGADAVAAGNPGCAAQLTRHLRELGAELPVHHPVQLLWWSIQAGSERVQSDEPRGSCATG